MFRCMKHVEHLSPAFRGLHIRPRYDETAISLASLRGFQNIKYLSGTAHCNQQWPLSRQTYSSSPAAMLCSVNPVQAHGYRYQSSGGKKKGGGMNMAVIGTGVGLLIGGLLLKSMKDLMDYDDNPKAKDDAKKKESKEDAAPPLPPPKFPDQVPFLIIGAGTAAMTASKTIRTNDPTAKVLMVTEESYRPYMRPPLSKELWFAGSQPEKLLFKDWAGKEKDIFYQPEEFFLKPEALLDAENGGIAVAFNRKVVKLDVQKKEVHLEDGQTIGFEKCLLATGGTPRTLPTFKELDKNGLERVHLFRNIEDFHRLVKAVDNSQSVLVIGGGFLGSELAVALAQRANKKKQRVYQVFPESGNMGLVFPDYLSKWTLEKVRKEGVDVITNQTLQSCSFNSWTKKLEITLSGGEKMAVDHAVCAVGLAPNTDLAKSAGLETDPTHGGYLVNAELEARSNVWAAGDAACFYDDRLGRRRVEHHDHAVVSGRLAGDNMTGKRQPYGHQSMFWSDLGPEVGYEAIGICDSSLPTFAVFAKATEKDTPKAVVEASGGGMRSESETEEVASDKQEAAPVESPNEVDGPHPPKQGEDYGKGIIFYMRDEKVVGIILWNLFGRMPIARQVLKDGKVHKDLTEVARLFDVHDQKKEKE